MNNDDKTFYDAKIDECIRKRDAHKRHVETFERKLTMYTKMRDGELSRDDAKKIRAIENKRASIAKLENGLSDDATEFFTNDE